MTAPDRFDWDAIRARLARSVSELDPDAGDPERERALLRTRAAALAQAPPRQDLPGAGEDGTTLQLLVFEIGGARYGLETAWVVHAGALPPLTALPGLPNHVVGIAAFRGRVLAVLELRTLLSLPVTRLTEPTALVVLQGESMEFALQVDAIAGVQHYPRAALAAGLPGLGALRAGYLLGVAPDRTAVLDARRMLADTTLVVHSQ
jgi:purine-binding chemotaxis protein CheW